MWCCLSRVSCLQGWLQKRKANLNLGRRQQHGNQSRFLRQRYPIQYFSSMRRYMSIRVQIVLRWSGRYWTYLFENLSRVLMGVGLFSTKSVRVKGGVIG
ncbi:uncharacterized protein BO66DRAFT_100488 [Aspergillus aculeatinus CBS 121060]|uniref:Uncharacterized protein n=2 Tax=Aspergillus aculeatinus CBS 121060 TaxID=1448322 RepID=A0ACD1H798_9EURO|nr:hypothetical protein BO66DRAFT_100224 [Aspergillus aculeatinus CBS 121060]XP_025503515.1 hypothetical protein BO66DRAFT_100488 [Aspergillus aculeatinus CBS 121060]RAH69680.1 hypothetical protein BO66DRAFT_100224 [Aspergillus aculeatinus CBS 121060]RAH69692.1 hypothetical protein BO66DRAFT_100488 [Aspergillus aculeatinus CBS 121060]